ncbi:DUF58 domain-containing protein [Ruicaihuangia caeni]|uniref:DUF58 domain-containing protein n=1 Tax=Ruicaihuangia caeni TaxID=3042517 RepID=UPI00338D9D1B
MRNALAIARYLTREGWARVKPALEVVSAAGWLVLCCALVALTLAVVFGWAEFVFIGTTAAAALLMAAAFVFGRHRFEVSIDLTPRRVVAGERAMGRITVVNRAQKRSSPTRMELPVGSGVAEFMIPGLDPGAEHEELFAVPTQRRAVIDAGPALSVRGDQLGLLRRTLRWSEPVELFVHPLTRRLSPSAAGLVRDIEGEVTKKITNSDISFHALRPYEPGDDLRHVHWRTSARSGTLMVRQFEETRRSQLTIVHPADRRYYRDQDEYELAVSVLASLGSQVIRDGTQLSIVSEERALRTRTVTAMLDDSCRLDPVDSRFDSPREFARAATLRLPPPSVVLIVTGSGMPLSDFRAIERLFGSDTQTLGFRAALDDPSRIMSVGGLAVVSLNTLDDLSGLARRVR